jgi:hypothetical protein
MHDVDRTLREFESGFEVAGEAFETEQPQALGGTILGRAIAEAEAETAGYAGEAYEAYETYEAQEAHEAQGFLGEASHEAVFDEVQEMALAAELLEVSNEEELEQFLGKLIKGAARVVKKVASSPIGKALGPVLKKVAKTALPIAGAAVGNLIAPGVGGAIGGKLASAAGRVFGLELEGLSPQDREFEVARRFVRFAGSATQRALRMPPRVPPRQAVRTAVASAARRHAPGLLQPRPNWRQRRRQRYAPSVSSYDVSTFMDGDGGTAATGGSSGQWVRNEDGSITIYGA